MEKKQVQFILKNIHWLEGFNIQDEESGIHYCRKYLITTKPFTFQGQELSQLEIYTNSYVEFEGISLWNRSEVESLENYVWNLWWWEEPGSNDFPQPKIDKTERKIKWAGSEYKGFQKIRFKGDSLKVNSLENGIKWNGNKGRLEIKIKPVKISETIEINRLDIAFWRFFDDDVNQKILANFSPKKITTIYFSEKVNQENSRTSPVIEIENGQTKLNIHLFDLKNEFTDYSWLSSVDNPNYSPNKIPSSFGQKEKWLLIAFLLTIIFLFFIVRNLTKKKQKNSF